MCFPPSQREGGYALTTQIYKPHKNFQFIKHKKNAALP